MLNQRNVSVMSPLDLARRIKRTLKKSVKRGRKALFCTLTPRSVATQEYVSASQSSRWLQACEPYDESHYSTICHGENEVQFFDITPHLIPALGVLQLNNARLHGVHGWVFNEEGSLLSEQSWFGEDVKGMAENMEIPRTIPQGEFIQGTTLTLGSDYATHVYGHYAIDCLARLALFYKAGFSFDDVDHIYCPVPLKGHGEVLFNLLGIPKEKCLWANDNKTLRCETLLSPSFPGIRRNYSPWVVDFFREYLKLDYSAPAKRRLYVTRKGFVRNPVHEEQVEKFLHQHGFETYNPADHSHSHEDFAQAEIVVGVSGSALTGLAFCRPGAKVLEILSTDHLYPYYFTLANAGGMEYHYIAGHPQGTGGGGFGPSQSDVMIDMQAFEQAIKRLVS